MGMRVSLSESFTRCWHCAIFGSSVLHARHRLLVDAGADIGATDEVDCQCLLQYLIFVKAHSSLLLLHSVKTVRSTTQLHLATTTSWSCCWTGARP